MTGASTMALAKDVLVVGSCMIDLISYAPRLPLTGETIHGTKFVVGLGGKGCNQCVAAKKLGANTALVARLGSDSFGRDYADALKKMGVSTEHVQLTGDISSGMAQIIVADGGENQIVIVAGANDLLTIDDVNSAAAEIAASRVLLTQMEVPSETTIRALEIKADSGQGISIFNAAPAQTSLPPQLYRLPTIFCVNETEAELLIGKTLKNIADAEEASRLLRSRGCQHVIITLGADGAAYLDMEGKFFHLPTFANNVMDTTGAGDAFLGALAYFLSKKEDIKMEEAVRRACQVAAASVEKPGTQSSFPTRNDLPSTLFE